MKEWIIPAIVVIFWVLNALLRNKDNEEPVRKPRGKPGDDRPARNPGSDIDRFLQEIERMKKKAAAEAPMPPKPVRTAAPVVRPVPTAVQPARAAVRTKLRPAASPPPAVLVVQPSRLEAPVQSGRTILPPATPPAPTRRPFAGAMDLLRSPNAAQQAIVLNEIFGPPKALRRQS